MTPTLDPEYTKMLSTQAPLEGSRKDAIDSLQRQIDFHLSQVYRLRTAQNSHVAISRLPPELLSDVFLFIVEAGLGGKGTYFTDETFAFLRVCRRWNEVAVAFPQLWVWWIPGTFKAWHLFKSRSKDAPLCLTWRENFPESAHTVLTESETPKRIRQLDISDNTLQFECILNALDSRSLSTTSSIRLRMLRSQDEEHFTRFFSFPFPRLSDLDVGNFLPDPASSILRTSNLTSLKLDILRPDGHCYTKSQLSQVLQQNRNLRQLVFAAGGLPLAGDSGGLVPVLLPHLVDLTLYGTNEVIDGFVDLVCMSSPLHKISIHFRRDNFHHPGPHINTTQKLLTAYYGCEELERRRKVSHLTVRSNTTVWSPTGIIIAKDHLTDPTCSLELEFQNDKDEHYQEIIPLFPLDQVHDYAVAGLEFATETWRGILLRMEGLSHLQLGSMEPESVLNALVSNDGDQPVSLELKSLSFDRIEFSAAALEILLDVVTKRCDNLDSLTMQWCRVPRIECRADFEGLVKNVVWETMTETDPVYDETESEGDMYLEDDSDDDDDD